MDLVPSLKESIFNPLSGPMIETSEVFLDTVFENGILKDIPIIGTIAGLSKATIALRERQLAKNTYAFIKGIREKNIPEEKLKKYKRKLEDPRQAEKELGLVLRLLDHEIYVEKAEILGRAYAAVVGDRIDMDQFREIAEAVNRMFMADFVVLKQLNAGTPLTDGMRVKEAHGLQRLKSLGLAIETEERTWDDVANGDRLVISEFGKLLINFVEGI